MSYLVFALAILIIAALSIHIFLLHKKLRKTHQQLKELIKENGAQAQKIESKSNEISFKTDKDLLITDVSDSLCENLGHKKEELVGKALTESLFDKKDAAKLKALRNKIVKTASIINSEHLLLDAQGKKNLMKCHQRPILNEVLECEGISFLCKDISEAKVLQKKLKDIKNLDVLTGVSDQNEFMQRLEHDFKRAQRYNEDFALVVVDVNDLCDFINKGISFERGDNLLKNIAGLAVSNAPNHTVGRFDKTKFGIILNKVSRSKAQELAERLYKESKPVIRKLGVDDYNAQMLIISYTERKGYNDTYDNMLARVNRHIRNAAQRHEYGVTSSDNEKNKL